MESLTDPESSWAGEEELVELEGRSDPVLGAHNDRRRIQIVEAQVGDVPCNVVHKGASEQASEASRTLPVFLTEAMIWS